MHCTKLAAFPHGSKVVLVVSGVGKEDRRLCEELGNNWEGGELLELFREGGELLGLDREGFIKKSPFWKYIYFSSWLAIEGWVVIIKSDAMIRPGLKQSCPLLPWYMKNVYVAQPN